jgi:hypothetical protein
MMLFARRMGQQQRTFTGHTVRDGDTPTHIMMRSTIWESGAKVRTGIEMFKVERISAS